MTEPDRIPYNLPHFGARAVANITALNRNTLVGWVNRYDLRGIGIQPGAAGAQRLYTMEQVGILAVLRIVAAVNELESACDALASIAEHAEALYQKMEEKIWQGAEMPALIVPDRQSHLEARVGLFGNVTVFSVTDSPYGAPDAVRDLDGFPLPRLLIPLDATLCMAWYRSAQWARGFARG